MKSFLEYILGINTKLRAAFVITALSIAIVNVPVLTDWLQDGLKSTVRNFAWGTIQASILAALAWAKQSNVSGTGAPGDPQIKPENKL